MCRGGASLPPPTLAHESLGDSSTLRTLGRPHPQLHQQGWLCCAARARCTTCSLLSIAAGVGRGSSHSLVNSGSALPPVLGDAGGHLSSHPCHHMENEANMANTRSLLLTFPGPAHPCLVNRVSSFSCPDEVQACFRNQVLLLVERRQKEQGERASLPHPHRHTTDKGGGISYTSLTPSGIAHRSPCLQGQLYSAAQARQGPS